MAINTYSRRRSATQIVWSIIVPDADGTIGTLDRAHCAGFYAGLTYADLNAVYTVSEMSESYTVSEINESYTVTEMA